MSSSATIFCFSSRTVSFGSDSIRTRFLTRGTFTLTVTVCGTAGTGFGTKVDGKDSRGSTDSVISLTIGGVSGIGINSGEDEKSPTSNGSSSFDVSVSCNDGIQGAISDRLYFLFKKGGIGRSRIGCCFGSELHVGKDTGGKYEWLEVEGGGEGDCDGTGGRSVWFDDEGNDEGDGEGTGVRCEGFNRDGESDGEGGKFKSLTGVPNGGKFKSGTGGGDTGMIRSCRCSGDGGKFKSLT